MFHSDRNLDALPKRGAWRHSCLAVFVISTLAGFATAQERPAPETGFHVPAIAFRDIRTKRKEVDQLIRNLGGTAA